MGVASLVLGIIALVFSAIPCLNFIAVIPSILAVLFGFIGLFQPRQRGMAFAGFVCGGLAMAAIVAWALYHSGQLKEYFS